MADYRGPIFQGEDLFFRYQLKKVYKKFLKSDGSSDLSGRILYRIPKKHDPKCTQFRMETIPNGRNPEWTKSRMDAIPNGRNPEWAQSRISTYPVTEVFETQAW